MPGTLEIEPLNALCNRLRVIDSACSLAEQTEMDLILHWNNGAGVVCRYEDLFVVPERVKKVWNWDITRRSSRILRRLRSKVAVLAGQRTYDNQAIVDLVNAGKDPAELLHMPSVYVSTACRFLPADSIQRHLQPVPSIARKVEQIASRFDGSTVGVHIRRGDQGKSLEVSTLGKFITRMTRELDQNGAVWFFLATDCFDTERIIKQHFGERILTHSKLSVDRNDPDAIKDAVIELTCLSRTTKLLGSYYSSFSETAAQLGNIELDIVQ